MTGEEKIVKNIEYIIKQGYVDTEDDIIEILISALNLIENQQKEIEELNDLAKYTTYLEEKLMYTLGPKNKEFSDNTKYHFSNILRKSYYENRDTYQIKQSLLTYYENEKED